MYYTVIKHSDHLRTLDKCRKHSPAARVFYISVEFSNARRVLSQCNTRLRLLYLLINVASGLQILILSGSAFYLLFYSIKLEQHMKCSVFVRPKITFRDYD